MPVGLPQASLIRVSEKELCLLVTRFISTLEEVKNKQLVVLYGETGSGKTATLYRLLGRKIIKKNPFGHLVLSDGDEENYGHINNGARSETSHPTLAPLSPEVCVLDTPGCHDNRQGVMPHVTLFSSLVFPLSIMRSKAILGVCFVIHFHDVVRPRGGNFDEQLALFASLFRDNAFETYSDETPLKQTSFVVTHSGREAIQDAKNRVIAGLRIRREKAKEDVAALSDKSRRLFDKQFPGRSDFSKNIPSFRTRSQVKSFAMKLHQEIEPEDTQPKDSEEFIIDPWVQAIFDMIDSNMRFSFLDMVIKKPHAIFVLKNSEEPDEIHALKDFLISNTPIPRASLQLSDPESPEWGNWLFWLSIKLIKIDLRLKPIKSCLYMEVIFYRYVLLRTEIQRTHKSIQDRLKKLSSFSPDCITQLLLVSKDLVYMQTSLCMNLGKRQREREALIERCKNEIASIERYGQKNPEKQQHVDYKKRLNRVKEHLQYLKATTLLRLNPELLLTQKKLHEDRHLLDPKEDVKDYKKNINIFLQHRMDEHQPCLHRLSKLRLIVYQDCSRLCESRSTAFELLSVLVQLVPIFQNLDAKLSDQVAYQYRILDQARNIRTTNQDPSISPGST